MIANATAALVQPVRNPFFQDLDRRGPDRHACTFEATSHAIEVGETLSWGAVVHDFSTGGVGITLCYPFRPGTYLAVDVQCPGNMIRTLMVRVLHVHDQPDGQWRLGCEFIKPLTKSDADLFLQQ
jgi:hypothetical protein